MAKEMVTLELLNEKARYLDIVIPYNGDDGHLITFNDELMTELEYDEEFVNPMLDEENKQLKLLIDLQALKVVDWKGGNLRMWGKVRDGTTLRNGLGRLSGNHHYHRWFATRMAYTFEFHGFYKRWP